MAQNKKTGRLILLFLLFLFLIGCHASPGGEVIQESHLKQEQEETEHRENKTDCVLPKIFVHVSGEVKNPGLYELDSGSRIFEAIQAAGGFTKRADEDSINLAQKIKDESKIHVFSLDKEEKEGKEKGEASQNKKPDVRIDLNRATLEELMTLPGIGEKRAEAILDLRVQKGSFQTIEDLLEVEGIKEGIFNKIKDLIKV